MTLQWILREFCFLCSVEIKYCNASSFSMLNKLGINSLWAVFSAVEQQYRILICNFGIWTMQPLAGTPRMGSILQTSPVLQTTAQRLWQHRVAGLNNSFRTSHSGADALINHRGPVLQRCSTSSRWNIFSSRSKMWALSHLQNPFCSNTLFPVPVYILARECYILSPVWQAAAWSEMPWYNMWFEHCVQ